MSTESSEQTLIDPRKLIKSLTVEELCESAEDFFARLNNWDYLHSKPFASIDEMPELLVCFAQVVQGLKLLPDQTVLDFGAGSCWTARFLSQLGLRVIALDVSATALVIGRELFNRHPVIGNQPKAEFLHFDGHRIDLPDNSVDRITCWDAFHHVPNAEDVLAEMRRVLKPGGIAGFSEPGPRHSLSPQSQYEMRTNKVIENDIVIEEIRALAQKAGFTDMKVALFSPHPFLMSPEEFESTLSGEQEGLGFLKETRFQMQHRRLFFLYNGVSAEVPDSRQRSGLMGRTQVHVDRLKVSIGEPIRIHVTVTNSGTAKWIPASSRIGAVRFGIHLFDEHNNLLDLDYFRERLMPGEGRDVMPGETLDFVSEVPTPGEGRYIFQCDLVSEGVCWFEHNGAETVRFNVEVG